MDRKQLRRKQRIPRNVLVEYHPQLQALVLFGELLECYTSWKENNILAIDISILDNLSGHLKQMQKSLVKFIRGFTLEIHRQIKIIEFFQRVPSSAIQREIRLTHLFKSPCLSTTLSAQYLDLSDVPLAEIQAVLRQESRLNEQISRTLGLYREWDEGKQIGAVFSQLLGHKLYDSSSVWLRIQPRANIYNCRDTIQCTLGEYLDNREEYQRILECISHFPLDELIQMIYCLPPAILRSDILTAFTPRILESAPWTIESQALILSNIILKGVEQEGKYENTLDHLLTKPFDLIEVLLMNQEWKLLDRVIPAMSDYLSSDSCPHCHQHEDFFQNRATFLDDHTSKPLTIDCLDNLLIVYALQSLDIEIVLPGSVHSSSSFENIALDFEMPAQAPSKDEWIPDEAVTACMACKSTTFSMLRRRHHCRRCGRVVCKNCSGQRRRIPDMYRNLRVRVCDDCVRWEEKSVTATPAKVRLRSDDDMWIFSGDHNEDHMLRDQFAFEDAPSAALCLTILGHHSSDLNAVKFLLWECDRLESLLRPIRPGLSNPEIDYCAVAKMMKCLAIAAKIRVHHPACDDFKLKADIILMLIDEKCEALLPVERLTTRDSLRKLRDNLLSAGVWQLALDISVKCGFACAGVMQAWGLDCLKQGHYALAREKMSHCLQSLVPDGFLDAIAPMMTKRAKLDVWDSLSAVDRPKRSSAVLVDILAILRTSADREFAYAESVYYVITYGSHEEILSLLMHHNKLHTALLYTLSQKVSYSTFMSIIFLPQLQLGQEVAVLSSMKKIDSTLWRWESFVKRFCWYLETQRKFESLYNMQILMNDPIRASMTCIQFYSMNARNYTDLQNNLRYLITAKMHCLSEMHNLEYGEPVKEVVRITMDIESLQKHIDTIEIQIDITEFLSSAEENGEDIMDNVKKLSGKSAGDAPPTLFGNASEASITAILTMVSGNSLRRNFSLVKIILKVVSLPVDKIYDSCAIFLATENRFRDIKEMIICARDSRHDINFDKLIYLAVKSANLLDDIQKQDDIVNISSLIELICDVAVKIKCYTHIGHLKTAYLLAVQSKRIEDLRKIAKRAQATKQIQIRRLCEKYFADTSHVSPRS
ncbi:zinc finger FYVE domain-containing protein 26 homolog [Phlebotomus argentipes]|uniref:zinc finger FYVE domain-containing protein 26 homolog n=1 Tax=Phlebotomus argentipes TaxID=94469 RepID=UPI0028929CD1|nr:zinc finger FYVE domain-containing protein 26 homolog [Phlebotomus argentipes]